MLTAVAVGLVAWSGSTARGWLVGVLGLAAAVVSWSPVPSAVAVAATALPLVAHRRSHPMPAAAALGIGLALAASLHSNLHHPVGLGAALLVPLGVAVSLDGLRHRDAEVRRAARRVGLVVSGLAAGALALFAVAGVMAKGELSDGNRLVRAGIDAMRTGDYELAGERFHRAVGHLERADDWLGGLLTEPARLLPVVAQNRQAAAVLTRAASLGMRNAAEALDEIDPDRLAVRNGRIDLTALAGVEDPLDRVRGALNDLDARLGRLTSPWIVGPVRHRLDSLADDIGTNRVRLDNAIDVIAAAPSMLGADGPRRYLIVFTTPVETRGIGGFPGNFGEVLADGGRITVEHFGRFSELDQAATANAATCDLCPADFVDRYARFGFDDGPGGTVGPTVWKNVTMPANFPDIAGTAQVLYAQSGRPPVDGVALMDPYVLQQLLRYTGPVTVTELDRTFRAQNFLPFVLFEQYLSDDVAERIEGLDLIGRAVIQELLAGDLPSPLVLARDLGPLVSHRRLLFWTDRPDEQDLLTRFGLLGDLPELRALTPAGFAVTMNNGGGNKIDAFLEVERTMHIEDRGDDHLLVAEVTLTNRAPDEGLPNYLIGNIVGLPVGTNPYFVTFYSATAPAAVLQDGAEWGLESGSERGWFAGSTYGRLASGASTTYRLEYRIPRSVTSIDQVTTWEQPLVRSPDDLGAVAAAAAVP